MSKGDPIPTRFDESEEDAIATLKARSGLSRAEIIRRAVRLLAKRYKETGSAGFILDELGPSLRLAEAEPRYRPRGKHKKKRSG